MQRSNRLSALRKRAFAKYSRLWFRCCERLDTMRRRRPTSLLQIRVRNYGTRRDWSYPAIPRIDCNSEWPQFLLFVLILPRTYFIRLLRSAAVCASLLSISGTRASKTDSVWSDAFAFAFAIIWIFSSGVLSIHGPWDSFADTWVASNDGHIK